MSSSVQGRRVSDLKHREPSFLSTYQLVPIREFLWEATYAAVRDDNMKPALRKPGSTGIPAFCITMTKGLLTAVVMPFRRVSVGLKSTCGCGSLGSK